MFDDITHLSLQKPPEFLFRAVNGDSVDETLRHGLNRLKMPFIVMYASEMEAVRKIPYKKNPSLFVIMSRLMEEDGYHFAKAESGEWIVDEVPSKYLRIG